MVIGHVRRTTNSVARFVLHGHAGHLVRRDDRRAVDLGTVPFATGRGEPGGGDLAAPVAGEHHDLAALARPGCP